MAEEDDDGMPMDKKFYKQLYSITPISNTGHHSQNPAKTVVKEEELAGSKLFKRSSKYEAGNDNVATSYAVDYGRGNRNDLVDQEAFISEDDSVSDVYREVHRIKMAKLKATKTKLPQKERHDKHQDKPFSCDCCGSRFIKRIYLDAHRKKFHSKPVSTTKISKDIQYCEAKEQATTFASKKRKLDPPVTSYQAKGPDEDVDEIHINVNENMKKRLVLKLPNGKKLKMDIQLE